MKESMNKNSMINPMNNINIMEQKGDCIMENLKNRNNMMDTEMILNDNEMMGIQQMNHIKNPINPVISLNNQINRMLISFNSIANDININNNYMMNQFSNDDDIMGKNYLMMDEYEKRIKNIIEPYEKKIKEQEDIIRKNYFKIALLKDKLSQKPNKEYEDIITISFQIKINKLYKIKCLNDELIESVFLKFCKKYNYDRNYLSFYYLNLGEIKNSYITVFELGLHNGSIIYVTQKMIPINNNFPIQNNNVFNFFELNNR